MDVQDKALEGCAAKWCEVAWGGHVLFFWKGKACSTSWEAAISSAARNIGR